MYVQGGKKLFSEVVKWCLAHYYCVPTIKLNTLYTNSRTGIVSLYTVLTCDVACRGRRTGCPR